MGWLRFVLILVVMLASSRALPVAARLQEHSSRPIPSGPFAWQMQTLDTRGTVGRRSAMALDRADQPHLLYSVVEVDTVLKYAYWNGVRWHFEVLTLPVAAALPGEVPLALHLDQQDRAHVAYYDDRTQTIVYAARADTGWEAHTVVTGVAGTSVSLGVSTTGMAYLAWYDPTTAAVTLSTQTASGWQHEPLQTTAAAQLPLALILRAGTTPAVAFYDAASGMMEYAERGSNGWLRESVAAAGTGGGDPTLALDGGGGVHLAYRYSEANTLGIRYTRRLGTGWSAPQTVTTNGMLPALAIGPDEIAHIAYHTPGSHYLYHSDNRTGTWTLEPIDRASDRGSHAAVAVDAGGHVHVSYFHLDYEDLRYAATLDPWQAKVVDSAVNTNSWFAMAEDAAGSPHLVYTSGTAVMLSEWNGRGWQTEPLAQSPGAAHFASMRFDASGQPALALYDRVQDRLWLAEWNGQQWTHSTIESGTNAGHDPTLMLARDGTPLIAYWDAAQSRVKVAARLNGIWHHTSHEAAPVLDSESGRPSAVLSADGVVWISYYDAPRTDLRVARVRYREGSWVWDDGLVGAGEGHTGMVHHMALSLTHEPVLAYAYSDTGGNLALRYATYHRPSASWSSTQFRPLPGVDRVGAIAVAVRVGNTTMPRVAYTTRQGNTTSLWLAVNNGATWSVDSFGITASASGTIRPELAATVLDRLAYMDGTTLRLATRTTTQERPAVPATVGSMPNGEVFGWCLCFLMGCFDWDSAPARSGIPLDPGDTVLQQLIPLFQQTEAGRSYLAQYRMHGAALYTLLSTNPGLGWDAYRTLQDFLPGLEALLAGRGDEVVITPKMIAHAYEVWEFVALLGEPGLAHAVRTELAQSNNLQDYAGMTFTQWAEAIGVMPPASPPILYLPLIVR